MKKLLSFKHLIGLSIVLVIGGIIGTLFSADIFSDRIRRLAGIGGTPHSWGTFLSDDGNPGSINFGAEPTDVDSTGARLVGQTLTGSFWLQTVGWVTLYDVLLQNNNGFTWDLSGYGWNDQAGWVDFSGVKFMNSNTSFTGYAWNDGVGWINMAGATLESVSQSLIGKVKVIGNIGGNNIFSTTYNISATISSITMNKIINQVRKNIAILTRNLVDGVHINTSRDTYGIFNTNLVSGKKLIYKNTTSTVSRVNYADVKGTFENIAPAIESLIIVGADLYINESVEPQATDNKPRVIIVLKNDNGIGGNIYVAGTVTRIKSSLIAEGSMFSARFPNSTTSTYILYNPNIDSSLQLPDRQLYIFGSLISNNTIGGSYGPTYACPYNNIEIFGCTADSSVKYDLNFFRDFQKDDANVAMLRGYPNDTYDNYSVVIEYDPRLLSDPPPGVAPLK